MIRVNLLNDISVAGHSGATVGSSATQIDGGLMDTELLQSGGARAGSTNFGFSESSRLGIGLKVLFIVVPILLTYSYRQFLITRAQNKHASLMQEKAEVEKKLRSFDASLKDIEKFEEEKRKLNAQLDVIKSLSKERLKNVKSLDALQGLIPSSAWLNSLKIIGDKVDLEGFAVNDIVVSDFMQQLSSSIYFSHVVLADSTEAATVEGSVKKFHIKCSLESI